MPLPGGRTTTHKLSGSRRVDAADLGLLLLQHPLQQAAVLSLSNVTSRAATELACVLFG
jgi:hypothetical protein